MKNKEQKDWECKLGEDREEIKRLLSWYGDEEVLKRRHEEGYTRASFGVGPWFHMDLEPDGFCQFIDSGRMRLHTIKIDDNPSMQVLPAEATRMVGVWIFFHPDGKVATYENLKIDACGWKRRGPKIETEFNSEKDFDKFISDFRIGIVKDNLSITQLLTYIER